MVFSKQAGPRMKEDFFLKSATRHFSGRCLISIGNHRWYFFVDPEFPFSYTKLNLKRVPINSAKLTCKNICPLFWSQSPYRTSTVHSPKVFSPAENFCSSLLITQLLLIHLPREIRQIRDPEELGEGETRFFGKQATD